MHSRYHNRLYKVFKIITATVAIFLCGLFLIIFVGTYITLSSIGKNATIENKKPQDQAVKMSRASGTSAVSELDKFSEKDSENLPPLNQENTRDNRIKQGMLFFKEVIKLRKDPRLEKAPILCEIICNRSVWKKSTDGEEIWDQFNSFLAKEGSRAFDDPKFRLVFELLNAHADLMIIPGEAMEKIEPLLNRKNELSELEKAYWSANAPLIFAKVVTQMTEILPKSRRQSSIINKIMKLNKQCEDRSVDEIKESCQNLSKDF